MMVEGRNRSARDGCVVVVILGKGRLPDWERYRVEP